jgi:hypothetical protein
MHQLVDVTPGGAEAEGIAIRWQQGPIGVGLNGATVEGVVRAALGRLEYYQQTPMRCEQNGRAIVLLNQALAELDDRTRDRYHRGVLGREVP